MTRQHFVAIAQILRDFREHGSEMRLIDDFARYFHSINPNFQSGRFHRAIFSPAQRGN